MFWGPPLMAATNPAGSSRTAFAVGLASTPDRLSIAYLSDCHLRCRQIVLILGIGPFRVVDGARSHQPPKDVKAPAAIAPRGEH